MDKIIIKKADPKDLDLILKWRMTVLKEVFELDENADMSKLFLQNENYYTNHLNDNTHTAVFAYLNEKIVGCGGICYMEEMPSPDNLNGCLGYLMNIYTIPEKRKLGIGKMIVKYLINDARSRGVGKIMLESSEPAKKLYESIGFTVAKDYYILK